MTLLATGSNPHSSEHPGASLPSRADASGIRPEAACVQVRQLNVEHRS
jgi:hypothetical protein